MNFEAIIEKYTVSILDHRIKTLIAILLLVLVATAGARFLEAPSGYRGFVAVSYTHLTLPTKSTV